MKASVNSPLGTYLSTLMPGAGNDARAIAIDCYSIQLYQAGVPWTLLTYCNADVNITIGGTIFYGNSVLIDGLRYKTSVGLDVDQQKITISARPSDTIPPFATSGGIPFMQALKNGILDGAVITRKRAYLSSWQNTNVDPGMTVVLFLGRVGAVDSIGRTTAEITVNSEMVLLDLQMPRNLYGPQCNNIFGDPATCAFGRTGLGATFSLGLTPPFQYVAAGSTVSVINLASTLANPTYYQQGTLGFLSGENAGATANIRAAGATSLTLAYPVQYAPATGDQIAIYQGCDHTQASCGAVFNNLANFRGFPNVPWQGAVFGV